jgi:hypothetical protein
VLTRCRRATGPTRGLGHPRSGLITAGALGLVWGPRARQPGGWPSPEVIGSLAAGVLLVIAFIAWELRAREPMLPMHFFATARSRPATRRSS